MGALRKGKGYGGAGGQKRCKWCTERAGYDVSKSKHLCVQFMESMGRSDLAQEPRLEKRSGWDHDADCNKIKLEASSQSHPSGSDMQPWITQSIQRVGEGERGYEKFCFAYSKVSACPPGTMIPTT
ncbi:hypothetical protein WJX74_005845 [Apatococcus lobatus]|uniref:Uncharacterized protein n=1 Tax=Apatococcus lobatus TaxID=904363 RepID=A0AAW1S0R2_9CHLO